LDWDRFVTSVGSLGSLGFIVELWLKELILSPASDGPSELLLDGKKRDQQNLRTANNLFDTETPASVTIIRSWTS
jgi:hypothetical protein